MKWIYESNLYLPVLAVLMLTLELFGIAGLKRHKNAARVMIILFGLWLLVFKTAEFIVYKKVPLDFSVMTYFFFGVAVILPFRPLKMVASYCSIIAGGIYLASLIAFPNILAVSEPNMTLRWFAFSYHNMLLFGGLALLVTIPFRRSDIFWLLGWVLITIGYNVLMVRVVGVDVGNSVFYDILTANVILWAVPGWNIPLWYYFVYYPCAFGLLFAVFCLLLNVNRRILHLPKNAKPKLFAY